jgi:hypothetical protein
MQFVLQQTPSTQKFDAHCPLFEHDPPFAIGATHAPVTQTNPAEHSALLTHAPRQAPPEHAYGAQSWPAPDAEHVPAPSQT